MKKYDYDLVVIGGGAAGITAAFTAKGFNKRVALVERDRLGGECTWKGCVPSKALLKSAKTAHQIRRAAKYGLKTDSTLGTEAVMDYVHSIQQKIYQNENAEVFKKKGIDFINSKAEFIDSHTLKTASAEITAAKFIIASGSSPLIPPIEGLNETDFLTNENLFELETLPKSLLIIGGGPIGVEMAQAFNRLGVNISLVQKNEQILKKEEPVLSKILAQQLIEEGVNLFTGFKALKVEEKDKIILTAADHKGSTKRLQGEKILIAAGRKANMKNLKLDNVGIKTNSQGIITDSMMRTNRKNIYACGDVVGPYRFSHISYQEGITAAVNALSPLPFKKMSYENIIWVTFTDPELADLALTEAEAREEYGDQIKIYEIDYSDLDRAITESKTGKAKFICDKNGKLLGAHIVGERAGEIIHSCQILKSFGLPFKKLQSIIHAYPTYSEIVRDGAKEAFISDWEKRLNFFKKFNIKK